MAPTLWTSYAAWAGVVHPDDVARPIEGRHLHYAGWVAGTMAYHGLDFEVIVDENGNPTNGLILFGGPDNREFSILIPEPPLEWPMPPSMPT